MLHIVNFLNEDAYRACANTTHANNEKYVENSWP